MTYDVPYLQIEPTTKCNFTCGFCVGRTMDQGIMPLDTFHKIITSVSNVKHIQLQGEGEPFTHPDLFAMLDLIAQYHPAAKVSITTNGTFLTSQNADRLLDNPNVYSILVSIESPNPDRFRSIRGGNLPKIIDNMLGFMDKKQKRGRARPVLGFAVTLLNSTFHEFKDIVRLYRQLSLDGEFTIQYLQNMGTYTEAYNDGMMKEIPSVETIKQFQSGLEKDAEIQELLNGIKVRGFFDELYDKDCEAKCTWLKQGIFINHRGFASGCSYIKKTDYAFGNVGQQSMDYILNQRNGVLEKLDQETPASCANCPDLMLS